MQCPYYVLVYSVFVAFAVVNAQLEQQDVPYITFRGANLTNHSYVNLLEVGSSEANDLRCRTDLVTCCNREAGQDRGDWFFPDGTPSLSAAAGRYYSCLDILKVLAFDVKAAR